MRSAVAPGVTRLRAIMRLFSGKVSTIANEATKALIAAKAIETEEPREVEADLAAVMNQYVRAEQEANDEAKDLIARGQAGPGELSRLRKLYAERKGIKIGEDTLDYLLDQVVEILMHSNNVDEVFAEDHDLRRIVRPSFLKHMTADESLEEEVRGKLKHMKEGTSTWEIEYQRVKDEIRRKRGLG